MDEPKDHGIKLFGRTIPLPEVSPSAAAAATVDYRINQDPICSSDSSPESDWGRDGKERDSEKETSKENPADTKQEDEAQSVTSEESSNPDSTTGMSEKLKAPSFEKEISTEKNSKLEEERSEASTSQEKTLKKPDKILPCPRCKSMDTKFCYYNNYNVSQPRHFCKNCQRYWTAGGTMRNVPVGAGRRKSKNSASHYRHITVSESLHNVLADYPNGGHRPTVKTNGNVLTFGSDAPLCESMASVLNIADKAMRNCSRNGFDKAEELRIELTCRGGETRENHSNGVAVSNSKDETGSTTSQENVMQSYQGFPPHMPWFPGAPWPYPWNSARWSSPVTPSEIFPPGFPIPFYHPAAYWSCTVPGAWSIPWIPQPTSPGTPSSGPSSPSLGKHSRDENIVKASNSREQEQQKDNNAEGCLWIPKTLRIDDPGEAAKSSIWTTLGIKKEKANSIGGGGLFKAFQPNRGEKNQLTGASRVLQANPAALSRSLNLQESS